MAVRPFTERQRGWALLTRSPLTHSICKHPYSVSTCTQYPHYTSPLNKSGNGRQAVHRASARPGPSHTLTSHTHFTVYGLRLQLTESGHGNSIGSRPLSIALQNSLCTCSVQRWSPDRNQTSEARPVTFAEFTLHLQRTALEPRQKSDFRG